MKAEERSEEEKAEEELKQAKSLMMNYLGNMRERLKEQEIERMNNYQHL